MWCYVLLCVVECCCVASSECVSASGCDSLCVCSGLLSLSLFFFLASASLSLSSLNTLFCVFLPRRSLFSCLSFSPSTWFPHHPSPFLSSSPAVFFFFLAVCFACRADRIVSSFLFLVQLPCLSLLEGEGGGGAAEGDWRRRRRSGVCAIGVEGAAVGGSDAGSECLRR